MMEPVIRVNHMGACSEKGQVRVDFVKTLWMVIMIIGALFAPIYATVSSVILFVTLTYFTMLFGHSLGMHRMMIHRSFKVSVVLARSLIFIGVLVGMGGPYSIIRIHDIRDWAQRQPNCHDYFSHRRHYFQDITWQLFYRFDFVYPPEVIIEEKLLDDPYLRFFERYWRLVQMMFAVLLFMIGGLPWVLWGICLRVFVSVLGHWSVTYICHNPGPGRWDVKNSGVQAANLLWGRGFFTGLLSHGECWHNNHHAFPESAKIGLEKDQFDPAWWVICQMEKLGWAYDIGRPRSVESREDLVLR